MPDIDLDISSDIFNSFSDSPDEVKVYLKKNKYKKIIAKTVSSFKGIVGEKLNSNKRNGF